MGMFGEHVTHSTDDSGVVGQIVLHRGFWRDAGLPCRTHRHADE
jgi:hypothetical protein